MHVYTFRVKLVELNPSQDDITLPIHGDYLGSILAHKQVLAEDNVEENAADAKDVADRMGFRR